MNTRPLNSQESQNLAALNEAGIESVLLFITENGLHKSIFDATEPLRALFLQSGTHDFSRQGQGPDNKVIRPGFILTDKEIVSAPLSLYRPVTKQGDPRMWFSRLKRFASDNDVVAVFISAKKVYGLNLSRYPISEMLRNGVQNELVSFIKSVQSRTSSVASELLNALVDIAQAGPIKAVCEGDTAIGRSIETALGIKINSNREPDYKGIEIKSGRSSLLKSRENRATLFACVPDWPLSNLKSSQAILDRYGYQRGSDFKLYCTVSTTKPNSRTLQLEVVEIDEVLREFASRKPVEEVCIWALERLHERLSLKHRETFWIKASAVNVGKSEWFQLESIIHTANPSLTQFDRLLTDGTITMDHLIKRKSNGKASEKGPLFKIRKDRIGELFFGQPRRYTLLE